jgi:hypothetical protein
MTLFLQSYFWFMSIYLAVMALFMLFKTRKLALASISTGLWLEQLASYALLIVGLVGVYAYLQAAPLLSAMFWQGFTIVFTIFSALQYFMPKIQLLRKEKGSKAVAAAYVVGVLLLIPMFTALIRYGFMSPGLWTGP